MNSSWRKAGDVVKAVLLMAALPFIALAGGYIMYRTERPPKN